MHMDGEREQGHPLRKTRRRRRRTSGIGSGASSSSSRRHGPPVSRPSAARCRPKVGAAPGHSRHSKGAGWFYMLSEYHQVSTTTPPLPSSPMPHVCYALAHSFWCAFPCGPAG
eukprot:jgi/Mesen1/7475/ME000039S06696